MTEFALVLPILALLLFGVIQFGIVFNNYLTLTDAVRAGARKAAVGRHLPDPPGAARQAVRNAATDLKPGRPERHRHGRPPGGRRAPRQLSRLTTPTRSACLASSSSRDACTARRGSAWNDHRCRSAFRPTCPHRNAPLDRERADHNDVQSSEYRNRGRARDRRRPADDVLRHELQAQRAAGRRDRSRLRRRAATFRSARPGSDVAHRNMLAPEHVAAPERRAGRDLRARARSTSSSRSSRSTPASRSRRAASAPRRAGHPRPAQGQPARDPGSRQPAPAAWRRRSRTATASMSSARGRMPDGQLTPGSRVVLRDILVLQAPQTSQLQGKIGSSPNAPSRRSSRSPTPSRRSSSTSSRTATGASAPPGQRSQQTAQRASRPPHSRSAGRPQRRERRRSREASNDRRDPGTAPREDAHLRHGQLRRAAPSSARPSAATASSSSSAQSDHVRDGAGPLTGGHLQAVLHATRSSSLPGRRPRRDPRVHAGADRPARLRRVLRAARRGARRRRRRRPAPAPADRERRLRDPQGRPLRPAWRSTARPRGTGRIVTVFSPKGGTGKTVMATNLAASFAKHGSKRTLLLDLDLQFGDAAIMLGIEPEKTIQDLVVAPGELDPEKLAGYIDAPLVGPRRAPRAVPARGRRARHRGEARAAARGGEGVVRRDRRRHLAVLPRADARHARPDRRPAARSAGSTCRRSRTSGSACRRSSCSRSRPSGSASCSTARTRTSA